MPLPLPSLAAARGARAAVARDAKCAPPTAGIEVASVAVLVGLIIADEPFTVHSSPLRVQSRRAGWGKRANCRFLLKPPPVCQCPADFWSAATFFTLGLSRPEISPRVWTFDFRHERRG